MRRVIGLLSLLLCLTGLLCGCGIRSGDDLYALPKTSVEYESLRQALQVLLDSGMEYAVPLTGSNTQPVQDVDLDGDGVGEVVAFFRNGSAKEGSLQVYLFRQNEEGEYEVMTSLSGQGSAVNSVAYSQLDGEDNLEIILTWQISSGVYALSAYSVWDGGSQELLPPQNYTRYSVVDLDGNGQDELLLLYLDPSDMSNNRAEYYSYVDGGLAKQSEVYLSADLSTIDRMRTSTLYSGENALYVTGYATDEGNGETSTRIQITDVLALRDGVLVNVTRNESAASSLSTRRRTYVADQDLDGDGVWEIPTLTNLYERLESGEVCISDTSYLVSWLQFDIDGGRHVLCNTYYNSSDGWYLVLPDSWNNQIALARSDYSEGVTVERSIQFYVLKEIDPGVGNTLETSETLGTPVLSNTTAEPFMTIYKNTGTDQGKRSSMGSRIALDMETEDASYAVEFFENSWCDWTAEDVQKQLHIITTNWFSD